MKQEAVDLSTEPEKEKAESQAMPAVCDQDTVVKAGLVIHVGMDQGSVDAEVWLRRSHGVGAPEFCQRS